MSICAKLRDLGIEGLKDKINKLKEIERSVSLILGPLGNLVRLRRIRHSIISYISLL
jgi:ribosomal protein L29